MPEVVFSHTQVARYTAARCASHLEIMWWAFGSKWCEAGGGGIAAGCANTRADSGTRLSTNGHNVRNVMAHGLLDHSEEVVAHGGVLNFMVRRDHSACQQ